MTNFALDANAESFATLRTEDQQRTMIFGFAALFGWSLLYHTTFSIRSRKGFPDLALCREGDDPRLLFLETKVKSQPTPEQERWIAALDRVAGVRAVLVTPADWPTVERLVRLDPDLWG